MGRQRARVGGIGKEVGKHDRGLGGWRAVSREIKNT